MNEDLAGRSAVLVVVPPGVRPDAFVGRVRELHPELELAAVWAGDPGLRPRPAALTWIAAAELGADPAIEHVLLRHDPLVAEWVVAVRAARLLLDRGADRVVVCWAGSVALGSRMRALLDVGHGVALVPSPPRHGRPTVELAVFGRATEPILDALAACLGACSPGIAACDAGSPSDALGAHAVARVLDVIGGSFADGSRAVDACVLRRLDDPAVVLGANGTVTRDPAVVVMPTFDRSRPWTLDADVDRNDLLDPVDPAVSGGLDEVARAARSTLALVHALADQFAPRDVLRLPGGLIVDRSIRSSVAHAFDAADALADEVPLPFSDHRRFRAWLDAHYWSALRDERVDLQVAFAEASPSTGGGFDEWARSAFAHDAVPFAIGRASRPSSRPWTTASRLRTDGLNLVGYARRETSLGDDVRRLRRAADDAAVPSALLAYERTGSPMLAAPPSCTETIEFETTLAVVTAAQFPVLFGDRPELFDATRRMIGYWMWEIAHVPRALRPAFDLVDEIWTGSQFVVDALSAVTSVPVRKVTIPVPEPIRSDRRRVSYPPLADAEGRVVFVVVLDHFSVTERKNPIGAIRAFRRAFPDAAADGPVLLVKTMNAEHRWDSHQRVVYEAEGRADIRVWDAHLSRADQMALVASSDCLVSLHRGEGLGLHLAEAMWMGVPTIATRWSGNLELQDDDCAVLVDATQVHVTDGELVYPESATWADPDLDQAADAMRRLAASPELRGHYGTRGRARMLAQPSLADVGRRIAGLLRGEGAG